jgi:RPA family protein
MKRRVAARKLRICDLVSGRYVPPDREELRPAQVITQFGQVASRVNLMGTVIDKFVREDYATLTLDDGSEAIRVKAFREGVGMLRGVELGDLVVVIGKVREFGDELYVNAELVRKVEDPNAECLRRLEMLEELVKRKGVVDELKRLSEQMSREELMEIAQQRWKLSEDVLNFLLGLPKADYKPQILKLIESLDEGDGVEISRIFELVKLPEKLVEQAINELLASGEVYEPLPGRLRKVT